MCIFLNLLYAFLDSFFVDVEQNLTLLLVSLILFKILHRKVLFTQVSKPEPFVIMKKTCLWFYVQDTNSINTLCALNY